MAATLELVIHGRDQASGVLKAVDTQANKLSHTIGTGLKIAAAGMAAGLGIAAVAGIKFIGAASDLNEQLNKSKVVFGESAKQIEAFAQTSARSLGIAKVDAIGYAGTLGTILKGSGLTQEASAQMSEQLVTLAADMASFNNIPIDQALEKIRAGLVGESEPLRTVGVLLSEAAVKEKAYQMGLAATGAELTDQQKVQARYALILEQTTDQQGDFARTSDSLANRQRILQARFKDLQAEIGQKLLPVAVQLSGWALDLFDIVDTKVIPVVEALGSLFGATLTRDAQGMHAAFAKLPPSLQGVGDAVIGLARFIRDDLLSALQDIAHFIEQYIVPNFLTGLTVLEDFYNLALKPLADFILNNQVALIAAITAIGVAIVIALGPGALAVVAILGFITLLGVLRDNWGTINRLFTQTVPDAIDTLIGKIQGVPIIGAIFTDAFNTVKVMVETALGAVVLNLQFALDSIKNTFDFWKAIFTGDWNGAWNAMKNQAAAIFNLLAGLLGLALDAVKSIVESKLHMLGDIGRRIGVAIKNGFEDGLGVVTGVVRSMANGVIGIINSLIGAINSIPDIHIKNPFGPDVNIGIPDIQKIPKLQQGGIVRARPGGTLAILGEGMRDEMVTPLPSAARGMDDSLISMLSALVDALNRPRDVVLNVDGRELARVTVYHAGREANLIARAG